MERLAAGKMRFSADTDTVAIAMDTITEIDVPYELTATRALELEQLQRELTD